MAIVERLMQKVPENRYGCTTEVVEALQPFASTPSTRALIRPRAPAEPTDSPEKGHPAGPILDETPRPSGLRGDPQPPHHAPAPLPSRQTLRSNPTAPSPAASSARATEEAPDNGQAHQAAPSRKAPARETFRAFSDPEPGPTWEERVGPLGVALGAIAVCALAWFLTWKLF